jgi:hypothetical protein
MAIKVHRCGKCARKSDIPVCHVCARILAMLAARFEVEREFMRTEFVVGRKGVRR